MGSRSRSDERPRGSFLKGRSAMARERLCLHGVLPSDGAHDVSDPGAGKEFPAATVPLPRSHRKEIPMTDSKAEKGAATIRRRSLGNPGFMLQEAPTRRFSRIEVAGDMTRGQVSRQRRAAVRKKPRVCADRRRPARFKGQGSTKPFGVQGFPIGAAWKPSTEFKGGSHHVSLSARRSTSSQYRSSPSHVPRAPGRARDDLGRRAWA